MKMWAIDCLTWLSLMIRFIGWSVLLTTSSMLASLLIIYANTSGNLSVSWFLSKYVSKVSTISSTIYVSARTVFEGRQPKRNWKFWLTRSVSVLFCFAGTPLVSSAYCWSFWFDLSYKLSVLLALVVWIFFSSGASVVFYPFSSCFCSSSISAYFFLSSSSLSMISLILAS